MKTKPSSLRDQQLLDTAKKFPVAEARLHADQICVFAEIARRRLHLKAGYGSLFSYLVKELGYSKACAYQRAEIAKASQRWPILLHMLENRSLSLATAALVTKHLDGKSGLKLLQEAAGKTKEDVELIIARRTNKPVCRDTMRPIGVRPSPGSAAVSEESVTDIASPATSPATSPAKEGGPSQAALALPIADSADDFVPRPEDIIIKVSFATNKGVADKLSRVKDLLARSHPGGGLSDILETVLDEFLQRHDPVVKAERLATKHTKKRFGDEPNKSVEPVGCGSKPTASSSKSSRYIPATIKHGVVKREGYRCSYESASGVRCEATRYLEFDHVTPFALNGRSDSAENIRLLCSEHNRERARKTFGEWIPRRSNVSAIGSEL